MRQSRKLETHLESSSSGAMSLTTPVKQIATPIKLAAEPNASTDSPGTWRHPRLNEITRRRNATTFSDKNVRQIVFGGIGIVTIWVLQATAKTRFLQHMYGPSESLNSHMLTSARLPPIVRNYLDWACILFHVVPIMNIIFALMPLIRKEDDLSDIPLSEEQRRLLGLAPLAGSPKTDEKYATPPRYSRTPSIAGSIGSNRSYTSSPLSGKGSPLIYGSGGASGSPYSPLGTPLFKRGLDMSTNGRRSSIGSGSPFGASTSTNPFPEPVSPTPAGGKRTSVGLNNKWLYERGRRSSGSAFLH